jgi:hypothetical protein
MVMNVQRPSLGFSKNDGHFLVQVSGLTKRAESAYQIAEGNKTIEMTGRDEVEEETG